MPAIWMNRLRPGLSEKFVTNQLNPTFPMNQILIFLLFCCWLISCKDRVVRQTAKDTAGTASPKDTGSSDDSTLKPYYIESGRLELPDYSITLTTRYMVPKDSMKEDITFYLDTTFVTVTRKSSNVTDSLPVSIDGFTPSDEQQQQVIIRNLTDSFQIRPLFIQLVTQSTDIYYENTFIGYRNGRLQTLFDVRDTQDSGLSLKKNGSTLVGFTSGRDEVIDEVEENYPITIDLKTFDVDQSLPDKQYLGVGTETTAPFSAYRMVNGRPDSPLVNVRGGEHVKIDTFYRAKRKVLLIVRDSIKVEIRLETGQKKLRHEAAG
jgi:hypothetical protein